MKVNNWLNKTCFASFDDSQGGGGSGIEPWQDDDDGDEVIDGKDLEESDDADADDEDDEEDDSKGSNPPFDANAFAKAITDGLRPALQNQQQPKFTREEIEKQLGKPTPSVELIKMIRDPETPPEKALEMLSTLLNSQSEYLLKASGMAIDGRVQELDPAIKSLQQHHLQQQEKDFTNGVVRKYPALKGKGPAVTQAMQLLRQQGYRPASQSEARRTVAMMASKLIKQFDTNFTLKPKQQQSNQFMRPGSGGGRSSGGQSRGASIIDSVFKVR